MNMQSTQNQVKDQPPVRRTRLVDRLRSDRKSYAVFVFSLLPWMLTVLATAGISAAFTLIGYAVLVTCIGYGLICLILSSSSRIRAVPLAPALGIMLLSSLTALALRLGLNFAWTPLIWLALIIPGLFITWADRPLATDMLPIWQNMSLIAIRGSSGGC